MSKEVIEIYPLVEAKKQAGLKDECTYRIKVMHTIPRNHLGVFYFIFDTFIQNIELISPEQVVGDIKGKDIRTFQSVLRIIQEKYADYIRRVTVLKE